MPLPSRSLARGLPLRLAAIVALCLLAFALAFALLVLRPATEALAAEQLRLSAGWVRAETLRDVRSVEAILDTARTFGESGRLDVGREREFVDLMVPLLHGRANVSGILVAAADGREVFLFRQADLWRSRVTTPASVGRESYWTRWSADGRRAIGEERRETDYDPRTRPWFAGALALERPGTLGWTAPYLFHTAQQPGMTVYTRWSGPDGEDRIVAADLLLAELSAITSTLRVGRTGGAAVISADDRVLGLPRAHAAPLPADRILAPVAAVGVPYLADGHAAWVAGGRSPQPFAFESGDSTWIGLVEPLALGGQDVHVGSFARMSDFVPAAVDDLLLFGALLALAALAGLAIATVLARQITRPLEELIAQSERIASLDLSDAVVADSQWREIEQLAQAQARMRGRIADSHAALEQARRSLEHKVAERTAELDEKSAALADQLLFVQLLIDALPNPVFFKGPDGRFLGCNTAYEAAFGTTRAYLIGKTVLDLPYLPAPERSAFHDEDMGIVAAGTTVHRETRLPFADGRQHDVLYWVSGFRLGSGAPGGLLGVIVDISVQKEAERLARKAEARLLGILSASPIAVVLNRPDGRMLFANERASELAQVPHETFMARSALEWFLHPADGERLFARLREGLPVCEEEVGFRTGGPGTLWTLLSMSLTEIGGEPAVISWIYDITARRQAEREVQRLSRAVAQSPAMLLITSPAGDIHYANPQFCVTVGEEAAQLAGTRPTLLDEDGAALDLHGDVWQRLREGEVWRHECRLLRASGDSLWVDVSISSLADERGEIADCVWVLDDVSARRATETALRRARDLAEEAAEAKARFLANMSHEIRTPMNAIIGLSHLALAGQPAPRERDYLEKIHRAGTGLLGVINDILDFSRIEAGKLKLDHSPFALDEVLDNLATLVGHKARAKGVELILAVQPDVPRRLVGDALRLGQVLINLVTNALKFTERGEVGLRISCAASDEAGVLIEFAVHDTGIGMSTEEMGRLFEAFSQADDSTTRRFGGTGLGLSICKHLVALMGGSIDVVSAPGAGSTFSFRARFGRAARDDSGRPLPELLQGLRALVVDDHPAAREVLQDLLAQLPFRVDSTASGHDAVERVRRADASDAFGLVLMDMNMPGIDGIEATRRIKSDRGLRTPPVVIMVSAFGDDDAAERAADAGADGFLHKPVTASHLVDALQRVFGGAAPQALAQPQQWQDQLAGLNVLVVEDNAINQEIARGLLESAGVGVSVAVNGVDALARLDAGPDSFDAVLMDLQMPQMDGFECTRRLRADPRFARLPVISMTAHAMVEERQRCLDAGMNEHVAKPIDPEQLFATLAELTGRDATAGAAGDPGATAAALPHLPGLRTAAALRRVGGDPQHYLKLLRQFVDFHRDSGTRIATALAGGARGEAERIAHSVHGVAAGIGAGALDAAAANLERQLHHGLPPERALARFDAELAALLRVLTAALDHPQAAARPATAAALPADDATLARFGALLGAADGAASTHFARLRPALAARFGDHFADRLEAAISRYDFALAAELLDRRQPDHGPDSSPCSTGSSA